MERPIGYIRQSFFAGIHCTGLIDLNAQAAAWRDNIANVRVHGTTHAVISVRLAEEQPYLISIAGKHPFDTASWTTRKVSRDFFVTYNTNRYSVPWSYVGLEVKLKETSGRIEIYKSDRLIATHDFKQGRYRESFNKQHAQGLKTSVNTRKKTSLLIAAPIV